MEAHREAQTAPNKKNRVEGLPRLPLGRYWAIKKTEGKK